jgi:phosphopantothenoylcysteine decarboxylase / phosphopantothenate---cysteine ligase
VVAPAMDGEMYQHPATRANVATLQGFGYTVVEPETGRLASGQTGTGRLAETARLVAAVVAATGDRPVRVADPALRPPLDATLREQDLEGRHVVVTAGGTAEPIDPVRFIGNRSTGRMGVAVAEAAMARGAAVTLIAGHTSVDLPREAAVIVAETTAAMETAVLDALTGADVLVMAAAVADFRPRSNSATKLTRDEGLVLELEPTDDILAAASALAHERGGRRPVLIGFAAETGSLDRVAGKALRKRVDLMVANDISESGSGFGTPTNRVTLVTPGEAPEPWPLLTKREVADRLLDRVVLLLEARDLR